MSFAIGDTTAFVIKQGVTTSTSADDVSHARATEGTTTSTSAADDVSRASAKEPGRGAGYHIG